MIYLAYGLMILFTVGCVVGPLWLAIFLWRDDERAMSLATVFILWPACCLLAALPWAMVSSDQSPDITLKKSEWACTESINRATTTYVRSGNVMVPITSNSQVCDQYSRRTD